MVLAVCDGGPCVVMVVYVCVVVVVCDKGMGFINMKSVCHQNTDWR